MIYKDIKFKEMYINQCSDQLNIYVYGHSPISFGKDTDLINDLIDALSLCIDISTVGLIGFSFEYSRHTIYLTKHINKPYTWYVENRSPVWTKHLVDYLNRGINNGD